MNKNITQKILMNKNKILISKKLIWNNLMTRNKNKNKNKDKSNILVG